MGQERMDDISGCQAATTLARIYGPDLELRVVALSRYPNMHPLHLQRLVSCPFSLPCE
jgi:hypothetical protein